MASRPNWPGTPSLIPAPRMLGLSAAAPMTLGLDSEAFSFARAAFTACASSTSLLAWSPLPEASSPVVSGVLASGEEMFSDQVPRSPTTGSPIFCAACTQMPSSPAFGMPTEVAVVFFPVSTVVSAAAIPPGAATVFEDSVNGTLVRERLAASAPWSIAAAIPATARPRLRGQDHRSAPAGDAPGCVSHVLSVRQPRSARTGLWPWRGRRGKARRAPVCTAHDIRALRV